MIEWATRDSTSIDARLLLASPENRSVVVVDWTARRMKSKIVLVFESHSSSWLPEWPCLVCSCIGESSWRVDSSDALAAAATTTSDWLSCSSWTIFDACTTSRVSCAPGGAAYELRRCLCLDCRSICERLRLRWVVDRFCWWFFSAEWVWEFVARWAWKTTWSWWWSSWWVCLYYSARD